MKKPTLIIPVEIKSRDLYGRLYLAQKAAKRGYTVLIGRSKKLHKDPLAFPRGIVVEDEMTFHNRHFIKKASDLGYGIVTIDEESIAISTDKRYVYQRVHYPNLARTLLHFTRGDKDLEAIKNKLPEGMEDAADRLIPAGNPRLDLLREEHFDLYKMEPPHDWNPDDVILVNSRFSRSNPFNITREKVREVVKRKFNFNDEDHKDYCEYLDHNDQLFEHFKPMVEALPEAFPDKIIVYRPHPSENFKYWEDIAAKHENAHCIHTGTAVQWSINSRAMIHSGCTTAIESALLGANIFSYCPIENDEYDMVLANAMGHKVKSAEELFEAVRGVHAPNDAEKIENSRQARLYLSKHAAGCLEKEACDNILDAIDELNWEPSIGLGERLIKDGEVRLRQIVHFIREKLKAPNARKEVIEGYHNQKFPHTDIAEIKDILVKFNAPDVPVEDYATDWWKIG